VTHTPGRVQVGGLRPFRGLLYLSMSFKLPLFLFSGLWLGAVRAQTPAVQLWITISDDAGVVAGLEAQPELRFAPDADDGVQAIAVDETKVFQKMEGGGASFTDGAAWLINQKLSPAQRAQVMKRLFDPQSGIGVSFLRNPMGSSDLTRRWYTYDDNEADKADPSLPHFSIEPDRADVLPLTRWARRLNPKLTLMLNAWSPPGWMKSSASVVAGGVLPEYYAHHANYHVKTIQAYEAEGVHVDYVSLNNEPTCCKNINYPSVLQMDASAMTTMLKEHWFPAFEANRLTTKILLLDFNWNNAELAEELLGDEAIRKSPWIGGIAWHGYGGDVRTQTVLHDRYGIDTFFTERSGFSDGSRQHKRDMRDLVAVIRNWGKSLVKWPVAADEHNGPHLGGCPSCRGLVTVYTEGQRAGRVEYTIEYYTMGHLTKFVPNGAHRIDSTENANVLNVAFRNPDGSLALIAYNDTEAPQAFKVVWRGRAFRYTLETNTSATFRWR
jgi:glucosylceramidase